MSRSKRFSCGRISGILCLILLTAATVSAAEPSISLSGGSAATWWKCQRQHDVQCQWDAAYRSAVGPELFCYGLQLGNHYDQWHSHLRFGRSAFVLHRCQQCELPGDQPQLHHGARAQRHIGRRQLPNLSDDEKHFVVHFARQSFVDRWFWQEPGTFGERHYDHHQSATVCAHALRPGVLTQHAHAAGNLDLHGEPQRGSHQQHSGGAV